jgi:ubiquinone/menaquinone biosynthesis C-methylase UbiE
MTQKEVFLDFEGDNWFKRNNNLSSVTETDIVVEKIKSLGLNPSSILEIGSSNGRRLTKLKEIYPHSTCRGLEPSQAAIDAAPKTIEIKRSTADKIPYANKSFDLLIFGFCLYLCDPEDYFTIASEANRVLKDEGYIIIYDFYSRRPYINPYHHHAGIQSHKMDFGSLFLANPLYAIKDFYLSGDGLGVDEQVAITTIKKSEKQSFPTNPYKE